VGRVSSSISHENPVAQSVNCASRVDRIINNMKIHIFYHFSLIFDHCPGKLS
jgi:hypothetical protein